MEFTIDDVNSWISCCRDAGKRVWMDSNFAATMTYIARNLYPDLPRGEQVLKPIKTTASPAVAVEEIEDTEVEGCNDEYTFDDSFNQVPPAFGTGYGPRIRNGVRDSVNQEFPAFGTEEVAWNTVLEVQEWIKITFKEKGSKFNHIGEFINYVKKTIQYRLRDKIKSRRKEIHPLPRVNKEGDEQEYSFEFIEDESALKEFEQSNLQRDLNRCANLTRSLIKCFIGSPFATKAINDQLNLLFKCSEVKGLGPLGVLVFIERNIFHMSFQHQAKDLLGSNFNQSTWNSYNRRLKDAWFKFLESNEGNSLNERFKECRELLEGIIS